MIECTANDCREEVTNRLTVLETWIEELKTNHLPRINEKLDRIQDNLAADHRPGWAVTIVVTGLSSLVVGLAVAILK